MERDRDRDAKTRDAAAGRRAQRGIHDPRGRFGFPGHPHRRGRYKAALGTVTDVFDAQNAVVSANTNYANSLAKLDLARARLRHALADPFGEGYFAAGNPPASQPKAAW
jgi:hypothetical protein